MGVRTEDVSVTTVDQGRPQRVRKETYTTAALPFPSSHITRYLDRWRKDFRSTLLDWAGTGENPYGTNTIMRQAVKQTWYEVFPELKVKWKSDSNVILGVVSGYVPTSIYSHLTDHFIKSETLLNSWRSEMGKATLCTLGEIFSEKYDNIDSRIAYVAHGLDKKNGYNYVYANPEAQVRWIHYFSLRYSHTLSQTGKGVFQSDIILRTFAWHLKQVQYARSDWGGQPIGAMALGTAAVS